MVLLNLNGMQRCVKTRSLTNPLLSKNKINMQHLQPNTTLQGGKYRIELVLGQGGYGNSKLNDDFCSQL